MGSTMLEATEIESLLQGALIDPEEVRIAGREVIEEPRFIRQFRLSECQLLHIHRLSLGLHITMGVLFGAEFLGLEVAR